MKTRISEHGETFVETCVYCKKMLAKDLRRLAEQLEKADEERKVEGTLYKQGYTQGIITGIEQASKIVASEPNGGKEK